MCVGDGTLWVEILQPEALQAAVARVALQLAARFNCQVPLIRDFDSLV